MAGLALNLTSASSGNNAEVNADPVFPKHCRIGVRSPGGRVPPHYSFLQISWLIGSSRLANDTAQGAALGTIASCAKRTIILTGTLNGGYADELFNILFRLHPKKMLEEGFAHGDAGCAGILGNLWGSRKSHNHHASRQRLLRQSEGNYKSTAAPRCFTLALRPVSDGTRRFCIARRYFGCASSL